jgi:tetratricopeptide (TPR) repeat protein
MILKRIHVVLFLCWISGGFDAGTAGGITPAMLVQAGETADLNSEPRRAIGYYKQALAAPARVSTLLRARAESQLALDLLKLDNYNEAVASGTDLLRLLEELKAEKKLVPELLMLVSPLAEELVVGLHELKNPTPALRKLDGHLKDLGKALGRYARLSDKQDAKAKISRARYYLTTGREGLAESTLNEITMSEPRHSDMWWRARIILAGMQNKHGKPQMLQQILKERSAQIGEVETLCEIGDGQAWCGDYDVSAKTLNLALAKAKAKGSVKGKLEQVHVIDSMMYLYADNAHYKEGERCARMQIELARELKDEQLAAVAKGRLAVALRKQNRNKEADEVDPLSDGANAQYEFMLTDEEKEAVRKARQKKAH